VCGEKINTDAENAKMFARWDISLANSQGAERVMYIL
jgi:hypothetical protein